MEPRETVEKTQNQPSEMLIVMKAKDGQRSSCSANEKAVVKVLKWVYRSVTQMFPQSLPARSSHHHEIPAGFRQQQQECRSRTTTIIKTAIVVTMTTAELLLHLPFPSEIVAGKASN